TVTGSGEHMWFTSDAFQFAWKQVSGDIGLTADVAFPEKGGNEHRKAVLMIRQTLDADSPYADVALHGDGLTSLQYRDAKGTTTHEIQSNLSAPVRLRIEKRGDFIYVFLAAGAGEPLRPSGASIKLPLQGSFYVGIGVCSHDKAVVEKAIFTNVDLAAPAATTAPPVLYSALETVAIESADRRVVYTDASHFEAPNWTHDGASFLFNREGRIQRVPVDGGEPTTIDTGTAIHCNNDHGIRNGWRSAILRSLTTNRVCTSCRFPGARLALSRRILRRTGTAGRRMARRSPSSDRGTATSTSTPFPSAAAMKLD